MTTETKVSAALAYASKGWHVFPVTPNQKIPFGSQMSGTWQRITKYMDRLLVPKERLQNVDFGVIHQADNKFDSLFS